MDAHKQNGCTSDPKGPAPQPGPCRKLSVSRGRLSLQTGQAEKIKRHALAMLCPSPKRPSTEPGEPPLAKIAKAEIAPAPQTSSVQTHVLTNSVQIVQTSIVQTVQTSSSVQIVQASSVQATSSKNLNEVPALPSNVSKAASSEALKRLIIESTAQVERNLMNRLNLPSIGSVPNLGALLGTNTRDIKNTILPATQSTSSDEQEVPQGRKSIGENLGDKIEKKKKNCTETSAKESLEVVIEPIEKSRESSPELEIILESLSKRKSVTTKLKRKKSVKLANAESSAVAKAAAKEETSVNKKVPIINLISTSPLREKALSSGDTNKTKPATHKNVKSHSVAKSSKGASSGSKIKESTPPSTPNKITNYLSPTKSKTESSSKPSSSSNADVPARKERTSSASSSTSKENNSNKSSKVIEENANSPNEETATSTPPADPDAPKSPMPKFVTERKSTSINLQTFKETILPAFKNPLFTSLVDVNDRLIILSFITKLPADAQALLVHLSQIKIRWKRVKDLKYPELGTDLNDLLASLLEENFLIDESKLTDLREMFNLLSRKDVMFLANVYKLPATSKKKDLVEELLKHGQRQKCLTGPLTIKMLKDVKTMLGKCVKVNMDTTDVLFRVCLLATLPHCFQDKSLSDILFRANNVRVSKSVSYPLYNIAMETQIFSERAHFMMFYQAYLLNRRFEECMESKIWDDCAVLTKDAWAQFKAIIEDDDHANLRSCDAALPEYLKRFTAGHTLAKIMTKGIDVLKRQKEPDTSVHMLNELLGQDLYCKHSRGMWYESLSLILNTHLKNSAQAAEIIFQGIDDDRVHLSFKISLATRAGKLFKSKNATFTPEDKMKLMVYSQIQISDAPHINIQGKVKTMSGEPGRKMNFIIDGDNPDEMSVGSVEECAISHYKRVEGFKKGRHSEGSVVITLFALLFWDELYFLEIPDAFLSPFQTQPLDLYGPDFYRKRQKAIDDKLQKLASWTDAESKAYFEEKWNASLELTSLVSNYIFFDAEEAHSVFKCIGVEKMTKICLKLLKDFKHSRAGFPDLVVWTPGVDNNYKFVEVKSPNDTLSDKQRVWIDFLMKNKIPVEVCHVNKVGERYLSLINEKTPASADSEPGPSSSNS